ncbi:GATA transcription factor [Peziza echinospora]|nr:GATA transcription factor [Peziza echinospora]
MTFATSSPGASTAGQGTTPPICQNCTTSTTPLWRRDEAGSVLCNACGLYLKLHGRPRDISLKTDVIKSRNRVKNPGQSAKKKVNSTHMGSVAASRSHHYYLQSLFDAPGLPRSEDSTPPPGHRVPRAHKLSTGTPNGSASPQSRAVTPLPPPSSMGPQSMFDPMVTDGSLAPSPSLPPLQLNNHPSPGSTSSIDNKSPEQPQTVEQLIVANNAFMTRVKELELVNDMYRTRVGQLEASESNLKRAAISASEVQTQLRQCIDDGNRREEGLKRRIEELESELLDVRDQGQRKKLRVSDITA